MWFKIYQHFHKKTLTDQKFKFSHKDQELYGFSLTDHNSTNNFTVNPYLSKTGMSACQWLGNDDMHTYAKCDTNVPCGSDL